MKTQKAFIVNVYDLTKLNKLFRFAKLGVYHTAVVIDNLYEYYFGFKAYSYTGIDIPEIVGSLPSSMTGEFYTKVEMGESKYTAEECEEIINIFTSSSRWLSDHYNILYHNCNDFSYELCSVLLEKEQIKKFPFWVKRGMYLGRFIFSTSISYILGLSSHPIPGFGTPPEEFSETEEEIQNVGKAVTEESTPTKSATEIETVSESHSTL
ncbi:deSI-like protein [Histomonas meleagridis]|nr:deSI-like protein [Histomonas meleagridis]